jgi:hypothetical protein
MSLVGRLKHRGLVEAAVLNTLKDWMPFYIAQMERETGRAARDLPQIESWILRPEFEYWPEDLMTPAVVVVSPGLAGDRPAKTGDGYYRATWSVGVATVTEASDQDATNELAGIYGAAVRGALLQRRSLEGEMRIADWIDVDTDRIPSEARRTLAAEMNLFTVEMEQIVSVAEGPRGEPPADPYADPGDWPVVETIDVEVHRH